MKRLNEMVFKMVVDLDEQKKKIEVQKKKIQIKEKMLKEHEKQKKFRRLSEIVATAIKANIDQLDEVTLLGAFLEIAGKMQNEKTLSEWKEMGELYLQNQDEKAAVPLIISFESDPGTPIKEELRKLRFRWNSFRKEYCGYGNQKELEALLQSSHATIEIIDEGRE